MIVDKFKGMFHKKSDQSMERRAEQSRKKKREQDIEDTHAEYGEKTKSLDSKLDTLISEIKGKKIG